MQLEVACVGKEFQTGGRDKAGTIEVLRCVTFSQEAGEVVSIVGPSGCGKSTLLRVVDGLISPSTGEVVLNGRRVAGPASDRSMVFQAHTLLPWRTVLTNVEFGLEMLGVDGAERKRRATSALEFVGLEDFIDYYPSQLSGGMAQRVGLARALVVEPDLLLMDEPFGSLDAQTRMVLQAELQGILAAAGRSVIFVTHDIEEALFLGDRVIIMSGRPGRVLEIIRVPFERPRTERVRNSPELGELKGQIWELLQTTNRRMAAPASGEGP